jgi:hypothetical protein
VVSWLVIYPWAGLNSEISCVQYEILGKDTLEIKDTMMMMMMKSEQKMLKRMMMMMSRKQKHHLTTLSRRATFGHNEELAFAWITPNALAKSLEGAILVRVRVRSSINTHTHTHIHIYIG